MLPVRLQELEAAFGYAGSEVDYLCNIGTRRAFLYFEVPKAACSSIKRTLQMLELPAGASPPANVHDKTVSPLKGPVSCGMSYQEIFESERLFRFTLVRNPYSRVLACYLEKILVDASERRRHQRLLGFAQQAPISFQQFLLAVNRIEDPRRDVHWRSQAGLIQDVRIHYHFIGRFENFRSDFGHALQRIGMDRGSDLIQNVSPHRTHAETRLREFFGEGELRLAQRIYDQDFQLYGYSRELLNPLHGGIAVPQQ